MAESCSELSQRRGSAKLPSSYKHQEKGWCHGASILEANKKIGQVRSRETNLGTKLSTRSPLYQEKKGQWRCSKRTGFVEGQADGYLTAFSPMMCKGSLEDSVFGVFRPSTLESASYIIVSGATAFTGHPSRLETTVTALF